MTKQLLILSFFAGFSACDSVFFQPDSVVYAVPDPKVIPFEDVTIAGEAEPELSGWLFKPHSASNGALVIHFHGNAQNMTAHSLFSYWLAAYGFHVLVFDYRGYGKSGGTADREGAIADGMRVFAYSQSRESLRPLKKVVFGQSLGGAIAIASISKSQFIPDLMVIDSSFSSYRGMAQLKLSQFFLTWPLQWLPYLLISDTDAPLDHVGRLGPVPWLVFHSDDDPVVPKEAAQDVLAAIPKERLELWTPPVAGHTTMFAEKVDRERFVTYVCEKLSLKPCQAASGQ